MMSDAGLGSQGKAPAVKNANHHAQLALYREYRAGGDGHRRAYERLVASFSDMVWGFANHFARKYGVDAEDLFQDGCLNGIRRAIESYDEARHSRISTYVYPAVQRAVARKARFYSRQRRELIQGGGEDSDDNVFRQIPVGGERGGVEQNEAAAKLRDVIHRALGKLTPVERRVIRMVLGLTGTGKVMKHREIAKVLGKDRSRVSQIAGEARRKLLADEGIRRVARDFGYSIAPS